MRSFSHCHSKKASPNLTSHAQAAEQKGLVSMRSYIFSLLATATFAFPLVACNDDNSAEKAQPSQGNTANGDDQAQALDRAQHTPSNEAMKAECLDLRETAQKEPALGLWPSTYARIGGGERISCVFDSNEINVTYEGALTIDSVHSETLTFEHTLDGKQVIDGTKDVIIASFTAGNYKGKLQFDAQNQALAAKLTEGASAWLSYEAYTPFNRRSHWKLKSAESGELLAMAFDREWNWEGDASTADLTSPLTADLAQISGMFAAEGFTVAIDALNSEDACDVSNYCLAPALGRFLPVTITYGNDSYRHLYGNEVITAGNAQYRIDVIEASTDFARARSGEPLNCSDVPSGNHLHLIIAVEE